VVPTVIFILGWRLFFYSNEGTEPIHIHAEKGGMECKYWLLLDEIEIREAFSYNMTPNAKREIKKIIYQHFDLIVISWNEYFNN
jgi:Ni,Fe-hydrogenase maturation factor